MTQEELEKKAKESYWDSEASGSMSSKNCYVVGYIAGAKAMQEENEELKQQVSYLEDNLRVARKDREYLRDCVANGLEEFVKDNPFTSLRLLANKKTKEEKQYETCPYRSTDMGCDYCDYRNRDLKDEVEE